MPTMQTVFSIQKTCNNSLQKNNQSFVHYFLDDTITYISAVTSNTESYQAFPQNVI